MKLRTKRVVGAVVVGAGVGVLGLAGLLGAVTGDQERVADLQVHAVVDQFGPTKITEVIDYDFGANSRHGIYRTIPGPFSDVAIQVNSPDAPDQFEVTDLGGKKKIKIGDPDETINGRHRYEITYTLLNLAPGRRLAFDAVGTEWEVPIRSATIDVATPWTATALRCDRGRTNATGGCKAEEVRPGHLRVEANGLKKGEGVTLYAEAADAPGGSASDTPTLPAFTAPPADDSPPIAAPALTALAAAAVGGLIGLVLVRRAGREWVGAGGATDAAFLRSPGNGATAFSTLPPPPGHTAAAPSAATSPAAAIPAGAERIDAGALASLATTEFAPPPGITAAHGSVVLTESVTDDAKAAWLLDQTIAGTVAFDESTGTKQLLRNPPPPPPATPTPLPPVLERAFAGRSAIPLGSYDATFGAAWTELSAELESWRKGSGLWDPAGDRNKRRATLLGILGAILGIGGAGVAAHFSLVPLVAVAALLGGLAMAGVATGWELAVRTPTGSATWLRVESFRRFLHDSEVQHVDWAVQNGFLREYTAWAVAVGEIDRWNKALSRSTIAPQVDPSAFAYASMAHSFSSATHTASTAPSSSGGGGVGGGGGGGGGGSW